VTVVVSHVDETFVHELAPAGERWYVTLATPEPPSEVVDVSVTVPKTVAPGLLIVALGAVLSTRRPATVLVVVLPATSVTTTRRSYMPSATVVVSKAGGVAVHEFAAAGDHWYVTVATPEPLSDDVADSVTVARRFAPGSASSVLGGVLSTLRIATAAESVLLPAASTATTRRS
jgi:hypothetical protein